MQKEVLGETLAAVYGVEAEIVRSSGDSATWTFQGSVPARTVQDVEKGLPSLAHGEAAWWSRPSGDRLVRGAAPVRARTDGNPLDLEEYLRFLSLP